MNPNKPRVGLCYFVSFLLVRDNGSLAFDSTTVILTQKINSREAVEFISEIIRNGAVKLGKPLPSNTKVTILNWKRLPAGDEVISLTPGDMTAHECDHDYDEEEADMDEEPRPLPGNMYQFRRPPENN